MRKRRFKILRFEESETVWEDYQDGTISRSAPPLPSSRLPVLALAPDKFFFFHLPEGMNVKGERQLKAATLLKMSQLFPSRGDGQEMATLKTGGDMLGFVSHPALAGFIRDHRADFDQASVITTPFVLAWNGARSQGLDAWTWRSDSGPSAVFAHGQLHYLSANGPGLSERLASLGLDAEPQEMTMPRALAALASEQANLARLRLPLAAWESSIEDVRPWQRLALACLLAGLLLVTGQGFRLGKANEQAARAEESVRELYRQALGPSLGADPYGQLMYKLSQLKGNQSAGVDVLELLAAVSRAAPQGLRIDSVTLTTDSGALRGKLQAYEQIDKLLKDLAEANTGLTFTLEQATNAEGGVVFSLRAKY